MGLSTFHYLDKALGKLRDLGLLPADQTDAAPVVALLEQLTLLDEAKVVAIARTLSQASVFNEVVREQISQMSIGERYRDLTNAFDSIRDDAKRMVEQLDDGKIDTFERIGNVWMKATRGDIAERFDKIKAIYLEVAQDSNEQIQRERLILQAYQDFRGAIKESEIYALEVLSLAEGQWNQHKGQLEASMSAVASASEDDLQTRARLELSRDEALRELQSAEARYQIAKDISDNLTISYNTSEVVMTRLMQTTNAKERVYKQAVAFFGTNENVLTALSASFTGLFGLHESTETLNAMKEGVSKSLEDLADIGGKVQEAALKAGYGPTIRAESVRKLVDSVVNFQQRSQAIIADMRELSTQNAQEIRQAVEQGKQSLSRMIHASGSATAILAPKSVPA